jgi:nitroreductase
MDIFTALASRHSVRAFLPKPVDGDTIQRILDAAGRSPSGTNTQPWLVYVVTGVARDELCKRVLAKRDLEPEREQTGRPFGEYMYYSDPMTEPYISRRRKVGWELYRTLGVAKGDRAGSWAIAGRNYQFFDAPVGLIFTLSKDLEQGSWIDLGIFLQSIMLAAKGCGLDTCAQGAWAMYYDVVRECLGISSREVVVCGMSLGFADPDAPANTVRSEREPIQRFARFIEQVPNDTESTTQGS